jgi:hypothetical protein
MNKEQQELLGEAYKNYYNYMRDDRQWELDKEEFINKCKTEPKFSEKWGLKIEERELSLEDRKIHMSKYSNDRIYPDWDEKFLSEKSIPTKLITITYKKTTIEVMNKVNEAGYNEAPKFGPSQNNPPYISDDFQIGPNGAYEHNEIVHIQQQLIDLLYSQVIDLSMMSKIELGDDVIAEVKRLKSIIDEKTT